MVSGGQAGGGQAGGEWWAVGRLANGPFTGPAPSLDDSRQRQRTNGPQTTGERSADRGRTVRSPDLRPRSDNGRQQRKASERSADYERTVRRLWASGPQTVGEWSVHQHDERTDRRLRVNGPQSTGEWSIG
ncbi:hypothetical protein GCM10010428_49370 [Actinosynnema pretiosum subsp. pretiosum]